MNIRIHISINNFVFLHLCRQIGIFFNKMNDGSMCEKTIIFINVHMAMYYNYKEVG